MDISKLGQVNAGQAWGETKNTQAESAQKAEIAPAEGAVTKLSDVAVYRYAQKVLQESFDNRLSLDRTVETAEDIRERNENLFDFESVVNNVMDFVESRVYAARDGGADDETLLDLLAQAREGVSAGVADAKKILGIKDDDESDLAVGINKAHDSLFERIDQLSEQIFSPQDLSVATQQSSIVMQNERNTVFELTTLQGDTVSINMASVSQSMEQKQNNGEETSVFYSETNSTSFSFSVEGDLNEEELEDINNLIGQVSDISQSFYNGDLKSAFEQAESLGFNQNQIASANLNLTSKSSFAGMYSQEKELPNSLKEGINEYLQKLNDAVDGLDSVFSESQKDKLVQNIFMNQFDLEPNELIEAVNQFNHFNGQLLERQDIH